MRKLTFSRLGKFGRLGNQMFQIAGTIGLAQKHGMEAVFPKWRYDRFFNPGITFGKWTKGIRVKEEHFHHHEWKIPSRGDCDIEGYLQSEKYFPNGESPLRLRSGFVRMIREKHEALLSKPTIGLQIRRGDYVNNPNYTQLTMGFFISAMEKHFPEWENWNVVVFSDDIEYCRVHFGCLSNVHFCTLNEIESICLMSQMDGLIISNSSFGWWGAWFAEKRGAKIVRPSRHVEGDLSNKCDIKDLYPDRWIVHEWDSKLDMRDCTFTIPVAWDHKDREENLGLTLDQIGRDIVTNVVIQEQSGRAMKFEGFRSGKNVIAVEHFKSKTFHRTAMLNNMAMFAKTPYVANWDADVLVTPMQLLLTMKALRSRNVQMCYPYDGIFARIERKPWLSKIQDTDIGIVRNTVFHGMTEGFVSVGGAVFFDREYFLKGGGENERFISYGAEDLERMERFRKLGATIHRVRGPIYHMNHWVGPDSSKENPFFAANEKEYERVKSMSPEAIKKEFWKDG